MTLTLSSLQLKAWPEAWPDCKDERVFVKLFGSITLTLLSDVTYFDYLPSLNNCSERGINANINILLGDISNLHDDICKLTVD